MLASAGRGVSRGRPASHRRDASHVTDARQRTRRTDDAVAAERSHRTLSGEPVPEIATAEDLAGWDPDERLGQPGDFPFTRGVYPSMYRGRLWTMRQFAGFGTPAETNARYRFLLEQGQGGLSRRLRHAHADGPGLRRPAQRGRGRALRRRHRLARRLRDAVRRASPSATSRTSMTISGPATVAFAFFLADRGAPGRGVGASSTARCRPTSSRSTSRRRNGSSRRGRTCG